MFTSNSTEPHPNLVSRCNVIMMLFNLVSMIIFSCSCSAFSTQLSSYNVNINNKLNLVSLFMSTDDIDKPDYAKKKGYVPKWTKKATLADVTGTKEISAQEKGLIGSIPIIFQQGTGENATFIHTNGMPGQPLKLVASQAGQYIKYGCGKGECGTCESLCNGKYIRPCVDIVPTDIPRDPDTGSYKPLTIIVKGTKAKVVSSGKFFSVKSFFLGFWNNLLGMVGFVRDRRKARKNWEERMNKENEIKRLTEEKKRRKMRDSAVTGE